MKKKDFNDVDSYLDEKFIGKRGDYNKNNRDSFSKIFIISIICVIVIAVVFVLALTTK